MTGIKNIGLSDKVPPYMFLEGRDFDIYEEIIPEFDELKTKINDKSMQFLIVSDLDKIIVSFSEFLEVLSDTEKNYICVWVVPKEYINIKAQEIRELFILEMNKNIWFAPVGYTRGILRTKNDSLYM